MKRIALAILAVFAISSDARAEQTTALRTALGQAGDNRAQLEKALADVPADQHEGLVFLIENMPTRDLRSLSAKFLLENVALAYRARNELPWGKKIPKELFLEYVLPYANVDEERHPWRKELFELCLPIVKGCKTPGQAGHKLNMKLFAELKVRYSTKRKKPNQSPKESIEQGMASCTGLSILLSDACRSVCVPARLVGTPQWVSVRGNHTWVELWDGDWHFTGACEADPKGLDRGWFVGRASQAKADSKRHAIYAARFRKSDTVFPLVWNPRQADVFAENVTSRYAKSEKPKADTIKVEIRVWNADKQRVALPVSVIDAGDAKKVRKGTSKGESADLNDVLTFELKREHEYTITVGKPAMLREKLKTPAKKQHRIELTLPAKQPKQAPKRAPKKQLDKKQLERLQKAAKEFFEVGAEKREGWKFDMAFDEWTRDNEAEVRAAIWEVYKESDSHAETKKDFEANRVRSGKHTSPYFVKTVGKRPKNGWPLFIAMHGGGGVPKRVNDSQWNHMKIYYRDQKSVTGYKYLALRAPNDTWNGFYDSYVPPLIVALIRQFSIFGDIDTNKVFLMGYSHGGYGAFYIGPKIADRFAAVHASAAAPTDGTISVKTLRNTRFTFMIGERDTAYGRKDRCVKFDKTVQAVRKENPGAYPVEMEFKKGFGHGGLPDRDKISTMYKHTRTPMPRHITWDATDNVISSFAWVSVEKPKRGIFVDAEVRGQTIDLQVKNAERIYLELDSRLVDVTKPVTLDVNGKKLQLELEPSFHTMCASLLRRGDPELAVSCRLSVPVEGGKEKK